MAGSPPEHHMDWVGYCLGDCSGAAVLAFEKFKIAGMFPILKERRLQPAGTLSGEQQQMVAVSMGLMSAHRTAA